VKWVALAIMRCGTNVASYHREVVGPLSITLSATRPKRPTDAMFDKRRKLMEAWTEKVVSFRNTA
jgi:hypothetical protein